MASVDIAALIVMHYTGADPPTTQEPEPTGEVARRAKRWVVREKDVRELLALAVSEAVTRANEKTVDRYPQGSMHCQVSLAPNNCAAWTRIHLPKAEREVEKFSNVVPAFDELETYARA